MDMFMSLIERSAFRYSLVVFALCTSVLTCFTPFSASAQITPLDVSVQLTARVSEPTASSPSITVQWKPDLRATRYIIKRRVYTPSDRSTFSRLLPDSLLPGNTTSFTDMTVTPGVLYEYEVTRLVLTDTAKPSQLTRGIGYILSGIGVATTPYRGEVLLVVDQTLASTIQADVAILLRDLTNEGWKVWQEVVPRAETFNRDAVDQTKTLISAWYNDLVNPQAPTVFLIGRVAVPYSGLFESGNAIGGWDGHSDHSGSWVADSYYSTTNDAGLWTDENEDIKPSRNANKNLIGDGKFDNAYIPTQARIRIGRADFFDMPAFAIQGETPLQTEQRLLRRYLQKNHLYRSGEIRVVHRAIVDDNFGSYGEQFAQSGWRSFAPLVGSENITAAKWFPDTQADTNISLLAYGCGGGSYTSTGGVGTTTDFATKPFRAIFTMLFGSYFGDWDISNNIMRSVLASSQSTLTCAWAGRPVWLAHQSAMGMSIGESVLSTLNTRFDYYTTGGNTFGTGGAHISLLGDPTLRVNYSNYDSPRAVTSQQVGRSVQVTWDAPADSQMVTGYLVYRSVIGSQSPTIEALTPTSLAPTARFFVDSVLHEGDVVYSVRAVRLSTSPSGSFHDMGYPATSRARVTSVERNINDEQQSTNQLHAYPNPASSIAYLEFPVLLPTFVGSPSGATIEITTVTGEIVARMSANDILYSDGAFRSYWYCQSQPIGVYIARLRYGNSSYSGTLSIVR